ncbi:MAG: methyl-accepting chemotaxis protein [Bacillota bacterium]|nr:methyl-accepting chemotaxis protein [Bacillota bacterium]
MNILYNFKTHRKLLILNILLIINLVWISYAAILNMGKINGLVQSLYQRDLLGISLVKQVEVEIVQLDAGLMNLLDRSARGQTVGAGEVEAAIQEGQGAILKHLEELRPRLSGEEVAKLDAVKSAVEEATRLARVVFSYQMAGQSEALAQAHEQFRTAIDKAVSLVAELAQAKEKGGEAAYRQSEQSFSATVRGQIYIILIGVLINFFAALYISNIIVRPMNQLMGAIDQVAAGDLTQVVDIQAKDEIGMMARSFNRALQSMRNLIGQVGKTAEQVATSSQELAAISGEAGKSTQQVAATVEQLARGAEEQAKSASQAGEAANQMSNLIKEVTASLQAMVADSKKAAELASAGRQAVQKAIEQMESIRATVDSSAEAVKGLGERSREIGQIVDVITGIADQTNLLALNAAIEAARAGEQGRGFAVVAEEVRKLAEQSRQAAEKIASLIHEIQAETGKAVESMEAGTHEVAAGTEVIDGTGRSFAEIAEAVETMVRQINAISEAARQMEESSKQVVKAVENIANITEESAASAEEVSASAEEQTASVEEVAASADALAKLAQELQHEVSKFKI